MNNVIYQQISDFVFSQCMRFQLFSLKDVRKHISRISNGIRLPYISNKIN